MLKSLGIVGLVVAIGAVGFAAYRVHEQAWTIGPHEVRGVIRIDPFILEAEHPVTHGGYRPTFDSFVATQVYRLRDRRLLELAHRHGAWTALGRPNTAAALDTFAASIEIRHDPSVPELIEVVCTDRDPDAARAGVRAVIDTFLDASGANAPASYTARLNLLETRRNLLRDEVAHLERERAELRRKHGSADDLAFQRRGAQAQFLQVDGALAEVQIAAARNGDGDGEEQDRHERALGRLEAMRAVTLADLAAVASVEQRVAHVDGEIAGQALLLEHTETRIRQLARETAGQGRIEVLSYDLAGP